MCSLTVNGPVAALVAETDYTFLMFGGGAVIVVMAITIVSMVACRWVRDFKLDMLDTNLLLSFVLQMTEKHLRLAMAV